MRIIITRIAGKAFSGIFENFWHYEKKQKVDLVHVLVQMHVEQYHSIMYTGVPFGYCPPDHHTPLAALVADI